MSPKYDCIIVGGGPAAAHVAFPLVEAGLEVVMLDGGIESLDSSSLILGRNFDSLRKEDENQDQVFLGRDLSGAQFPDGADQSSYMTNGRFSYVVDKAEKLLPTRSGKFYLAQTLAKGGLSEVWGGASGILDQEELKAIGLPASELPEHYQMIIDRIGISGLARDYRIQPPATPSTHARLILSRFARHQKYFENLGVELTPAMLALLTQDKGNRKKTSYRDTDYWSDEERSLYRARFTIEEMQSRSNFHYQPERVVTSLAESGQGVVVKTIDFSKGEHIYDARYIIVAAGALNTVRILLKSLGLYNKKVRITSKPHIMTPCIDLGFLGKIEESQKHSLCQLMLESQNKLNGFSSFSCQLYTYKSLLLFKLLNFVPLTKPESLGLLSLLVPSMVIADSRFPSSPDENKICELKATDQGDVLDIEYQTSKSELCIIKKQMKLIKKSLRKLGLIPLKQVYLPEGSSAHYAGGIATIADQLSPLRANQDGKIDGFSRVFVADSSLWKAIAAKPPTLTIMANANRIGTKLVKIISS